MGKTFVISLGCVSVSAIGAGNRGNAALRKEIADGNEKLRREIADGDAALRKEIAKRDEASRKEMREGQAGLRKEIENVAKDVAELRESVQDVSIRLARVEGKLGVSAPIPGTSPDAGRALT